MNNFPKPEEIQVPSRGRFGFFGKVFLWFWLTILVVVLTVVGMVFISQKETENTRFTGMFQTMARNQGHLFVSILENIPSDQTQSLGHLFGPRGVWMFDAMGGVLFSSNRAKEAQKFPLPPFPGPPHLVDELIQKHVQTFLYDNEEEAIRIIDGHGVLFQKVAANSGKKYVVVQDFPRPRMPRMAFLEHYPHIIFAVFFFVTMGLCYLLARYFSSPILELREVSRQFSHGEMHVRVSSGVCNRSDELGELAGDFNAMAERLGMMMERQKSLLHEISHEIRSPLARMKVACELMRKKNVIQPELMIARIEQETDHLENIINQILVLTKLEDNSLELETRETDICELVDTLIADFRFETKNQSSRIIRHGLMGIPIFIRGFKTLLSQALENILRNALSFSPSDSLVDISLSLEAQDQGKCIRVEVADHGPGVLAEHLSCIFEPFYRCQEDRSRKTGGTGLGLAIARRSVERHGGTISAQNRPEGGFLVTVMLPIVLSPDGPAAHA
ncbi:MAG: ATP-binding protein [Candidatus Ozemobacteraceae bacterium]